MKSAAKPLNIPLRSPKTNSNTCSNEEVSLNHTAPPLPPPSQLKEAKVEIHPAPGYQNSDSPVHNHELNLPESFVEYVFSRHDHEREHIINQDYSESFDSDFSSFPSLYSQFFCLDNDNYFQLHSSPPQHFEASHGEDFMNKQNVIMPPSTDPSVDIPFMSVNDGTFGYIDVNS